MNNSIKVWDTFCINNFKIIYKNVKFAKNIILNILVNKII